MTLALVAALLCPSAPNAQVVPRPSLTNPRLQTVSWQADKEIALTAMPQSELRVVFELGERISQVVLGDPSAFRVQVSPEADSILIQPLAPTAQGTITVATDRRDYRFSVRTGNDLLAAYLVQIQTAAPFSSFDADTPTEIVLPSTSERNEYALRGLRYGAALKPTDIFDDGIKTYISFAPDQPLPAIFAVGPAGGEEVVNGYMRNDIFVIDRVYDRLVLRIDKLSLTAKRLMKQAPPK